MGKGRETEGWWCMPDCKERTRRDTGWAGEEITGGQGGTLVRVSRDVVIIKGDGISGH
jgi:hypothetical protein